MRGKHVFALAIIWIALLGLTACSGTTEEENTDPGAEIWAFLEKTRPELDTKREELKALHERLSGDPSADGATAEGEGEDAEGESAETPEEIQTQIDALKQEVTTLADAFYGKLAEYLNSQGMVEGAPLTTEQRQAFDWKAQEDILLAQEYITEGGDYKRAIDIYDQSLMSDEGNELLLAAKAEAERLRYMDEERFGQVKKKMTQAEIRALLGTPKNTNIREFPEKSTVGWFYPKEDRGAAGVYFKETKKDEGNWVVTVFDYDAVPTPEPQVVDGDSAG
ncbi:MAG: hypothetical protein AAGN66_02380 [Acidobacteriota bacterium]